MAEKVGVMTMKLRMSESPVITWLGGRSCVLSARRTNERTITIRVNEVTMTRSAGASERTVTRNAISSVVEMFSRLVASLAWRTGSTRVFSGALADLS